MTYVVIFNLLYTMKERVHRASLTHVYIYGTYMGHMGHIWDIYVTASLTHADIYLYACIFVSLIHLHIHMYACVYGCLGIGVWGLGFSLPMPVWLSMV